MSVLRARQRFFVAGATSVIEMPTPKVFKPAFFVLTSRQLSHLGSLYAIGIQGILLHCSIEGPDVPIPCSFSGAGGLGVKRRCVMAEPSVGAMRPGSYARA